MGEVPIIIVLVKAIMNRDQRMHPVKEDVL